MSAHDFDAVLGLFERFRAAEAQLWATSLDPELPWSATLDAEIALDALLGRRAADMLELLQRPATPDAVWFEAAGARTVSDRVVYALKAAKARRDPVTFVYTDNYEKKKRDKGMQNRFAVGELEGELKIITREVRCGECKTLGCASCQQQGWLHVAGQKLKKIEYVGEARKLVEPTHAVSKQIWDAL